MKQTPDKASGIRLRASGSASDANLEAQSQQSRDTISATTLDRPA